MSSTLIRFFTGCASMMALTTAACAEPASEEIGEAVEAEAAVHQPADEVAETVAPGQEIIDSAPDSDWRTVPADRLMVIDTTQGRVWVELAPEFAPNHVARMTELMAENYYDYKVWHRVIDGFMAQGGGAINDPNAAPDKPTLQAEFTVQRGADLPVSELQMRAINPRSIPVEVPAGFWNGMPAGTQPIAQAAIRADGKVESWLLHCPGAAAMARTDNPNSARGQFYITRDDAPHLNAQYTVWGFTRVGLEAIQNIKVGAMAEDPYFIPDNIEEMQLATNLPEDERITIEVMDTRSDSFNAYLDVLRADNDGELPDICEINVPVRVTE